MAFIAYCIFRACHLPGIRATLLQLLTLHNLSHMALPLLAHHYSQKKESTLCHTNRKTFHFYGFQTTEATQWNLIKQDASLHLCKDSSLQHRPSNLHFCAITLCYISQVTLPKYQQKASRLKTKLCKLPHPTFNHKNLPNTSTKCTYHCHVLFSQTTKSQCKHWLSAYGMKPYLACSVNALHFITRTHNLCIAISQNYLFN